MPADAGLPMVETVVCTSSYHAFLVLKSPKCRLARWKSMRKHVESCTKAWINQVVSESQISELVQAVSSMCRVAILYSVQRRLKKITLAYRLSRLRVRAPRTEALRCCVAAQ